MTNVLRSLKNLPLMILAPLVIGSCAGSVPEPTPQHAELASKRWPGTTLEYLITGRNLYVQHCSSCHSLYSPNSYSPAHWSSTMLEMKVRAKIGEDEALNIAKYLITLSEADSASSR